MGYKHGLRNKFYVSSTAFKSVAGTPGTPTWVLLDLVESVGNEDSREEAEVKNRKGDFVTYGVGKRTLSYTLPCTLDEADTAQAIVWAAYRAGTPIAIADMDGLIATSGSKGMQMDIVVTQAPKPSDLAAFDTVEFVFKPAAESDKVPTLVTVT
jgi:hypothetical protein